MSISCKFAVPVFLAISGAMMLDREVVWTPYIQTYHELFAGVYGAAVFLTVREAARHIPEQGRATKIIAGFGKCTLGVYLLHSILMEYTWLFREGLWMPLHALGWPRLLLALVYVLAVFLTGSAMTAVLKRLSGFKWLKEEVRAIFANCRRAITIRVLCAMRGASCPKRMNGS